MKILGLHHITLVCADAQRTVDFYTKILGLRFIKQTVNFDDPTSYHIYFGDAVGTPGSAITFFEWAHAPKGRVGVGGTHHFALGVADENGLLKWKRRLTDLGIAVKGIYDRHYFKSIYFKDPDGANIEIATQNGNLTIDETLDALGTTYQQVPNDKQRANRDEETIAQTTWHEPVPTITADMALRFGMHHITAITSDIERTHHFFGEVLGMRRVKMTGNFDAPDSAHWYWGDDEGRFGTLITYLEHEEGKVRRAQMGRGLTHHFALAVKDEHEQVHWRARLAQAGFRSSNIINRDYFKSVYTNDPDGHIVELATLEPGFAIDEPIEKLGHKLQLPQWLEQHRPLIESNLKPLVVPEWRDPAEAKETE